MLRAAQPKTRYLPILDITGMFPSCITQIGRAAFPLVIEHLNSLLTVLVLEVAVVNAREGLLVDLRRYAASSSMMISDLKQ